MSNDPKEVAKKVFHTQEPTEAMIHFIEDVTKLVTHLKDVVVDRNKEDNT